VTRTGALGGGAAICLALLTAACASWPNERGGGGAELPWAPPVAADAVPLDRRVDACQASLEAIRAAGAERKAPAALLTAQMLLVRSGREVAGGLYQDAAAGLDQAASTLEGAAALVGSEVSIACLA